MRLLPCLHASNHPAAFTPSNINMLILHYTNGTLFTRQNHKLNVQGAEIDGYKTIYSLSATAATRLLPVEQLVMKRSGHGSLVWRCLQLREDLTHTVFWHPQLLKEITNWLQQWNMQCSHSSCCWKLHQLYPQHQWHQQHHPWKIFTFFHVCCLPSCLVLINW